MNKLFNFIKSAPVQPTDGSLSFGIESADVFRITSSFNLTAETKAYSMMKGTLLFQQQTNDPAKVNVILRPFNPSDFVVPVKYVIYRGLKTSDFLDFNTLTNPLNKVKTTGSELLVKMKELQGSRSPGDDIPVEALFGMDISPLSTAPIIDFYFKKTTSASSLYTIDGGVELGNFAIGEVGIEILLENPDYDLTVLDTKESVLKIDVTTDAAIVKKSKREKARHFIDPPAFYGLHGTIADGIGYKDTGGADQIANTRALVFTHIQSQFDNKNTVYLDVRNENGYSYNYYDNYIGSTGTLTDDTKELKTGANVGSLALKEYYTSEWPIHIVDVISASGTLNENTFYLSLRVNDNERPLIASDLSAVSPVVVEDSGVSFIDETILLPTPIPAILPEFTNPITIKVPNIPGSTGTQPATFVRIHYYKQNLPLSSSTKFPLINFSDYLFGPLNVSIPFDSGSNIQWITSYHKKYVDSLNDGHIIGQQKVPIISIQAAIREIEIFDDVPVDKTAVVVIENDNSTTLNEGTYNIDSVTSSGGTTIITIKESIPGHLQTGDNLVLSVFVQGEVDFTANKFIIKDKDYSGLPAFVPGSQLDFYSKYVFSNSYTVANTAFVSPNTEIFLVEEAKKVGYAGVIETGFILEADQSSGGPFDDDRLVFYAAPTGYFSADGVKHGTSFANKGGASDLESILEVLKKMMPDVLVDQISLKTSSTTDVISFAYKSISKAKEMLFLLGITKTEYQGIPFASFDTAHMVLVKLKAVGGRQADLNKISYFKYELCVAGLNSSSVYQDISTGLFVYSTDNLIFVSQAFAARYGIDVTVATQALNDFIQYYDFKDLKNYTFEEENMLKQTTSYGPKNKTLLGKDPTMVAKVTAFKAALDAVTDTEAEIKTLLELHGAGLFQHFKQRIKMPGELFTNKDAILYIARLRMQVIMKNHPLILSKYPSKIRLFYNIFELHSRGLAGTEMPNFSAVPSGVKKILVSGFDPFQGGADWQGDISNPSGNIALAISDTNLLDSSSALKGVIKVAMFPVRWEDFDKGFPTGGVSKGVAEDFFEPYFTGSNKPDMIITYSYGVHYNAFSNHIDHDYHLERFAANWQTYSGDNNGTTNFDRSTRPTIPKVIEPLPATGPEKDWVFIESTLPFHKLESPPSSRKIKVGNYHVVVNHGPVAGNGISWNVWGKDSMGVVQNLNSEVMIPSVPAAYFPDTPFIPIVSNADITAGWNTPKAMFVGRFLVCDNDETKYFYPRDRTTNPSFIPLPTWDNYKIPAVDSAYTNIRIEAQNGSGGTYMSNLIFYRVAYLRMKNGDIIPTGHIHMGFNSGADYDPHGTLADNRQKMLEDVIEILKKFNDIV